MAAAKSRAEFRLYESTIAPICAVLREAPPFEYDIVSRRWTG